MNVKSEYARLRRAGWLASNALRGAKINAAFYYREDSSSYPSPGSVRLRIEPDDSASLDDLEGDTFNPEVNPEIPRARLEREQKEFREKVEREGVVGVISEWFDGEKWHTADSCWGFVGDDWKDSGYDHDLKRAALDAAEDYIPRGYEVFRHDGQAATGEDGEPLEPGWYWWACWPGCLPDGDRMGPFKTRAEAIADLQEGL